MSIPDRFTAAARRSAAISSKLSLPDIKANLQEFEVLAKKRRVKNDQKSMREKTVAHLLDEVSAKCSKKKRLEVMCSNGIYLLHVKCLTWKVCSV